MYIYIHMYIYLFHDALNDDDSHGHLDEEELAAPVHVGAGVRDILVYIYMCRYI